MLAKATAEAKSTDAKSVAAKLEGMKIEVFDGGEAFMRKDDHQFFQHMYISSFGRPRSRREIRRRRHRLGLED